MAADQVEISDANVLLIYGVGEHNALELEESVAKIVKGGNITALDWTTQSWVPLCDLKSVSYTYLADLSEAFGTAAARSVQRCGQTDRIIGESWPMDLATAIVSKSSLAIVLMAFAVLLWCFPYILLNPLMPVTFVPVALSCLKNVVIAAVTLDILASLALFLIGAAEHKTVSLHAVCRRLVLMHLRPFLYCVLLPLTVRPLLFAGPIILLVSVGSNYAQILGAPDVEQTHSIWAAMLVFLAARFGPFVAQAIIQWLVGPTRQSLKILADVVMYLGDSYYRQNILREFQTKNRIDSSKALCVIVAHSLGSVIATDGLRMAAIPLRTILVTMGSPLAKWFHVYFPADYPAPAVICQEIKDKGPFSWVNVFRPYDPVGTSLSLPNRTEIFDINTEQQHLRKMDAHSNYFTDPLVRDLVVARVAQFKSCDPVGSRETSASNAVLANAGQRPSRDIKMISALIALAVYLLCMANTWVWFPQHRQDEINKYIATIESNGAVTAGIIVRTENNMVTFDSPGLSTYQTITYKILFNVPGPRGGYKESNGPFYWLNEHSTEGLGWSPQLTPVSSHLVSFSRVNRAAVQVRYLITDPTRFYVPRVAALDDNPNFKRRQVGFSVVTAILFIPLLWHVIVWLCGGYLGIKVALLDDPKKYSRTGHQVSK